jgi:hypothetical protein
MHPRHESTPGDNRPTLTNGGSTHNQSCMNAKTELDLQERAEEAEREQPAARTDRKIKIPASTSEILRPPWPLFPPVNGLRRSG